MDNVKTNNKKPNVVDIIVLTVIICGLVAVAFFAITMFKDGFDIFKSDNESQPDVEYTVRMPNVDVNLYSITLGADNIVGCPSLQVGDTVYDQYSGKVIGRISSIVYEECKVSTGKTDEAGNLIYADYPGYVDLLITVSAVSDGESGACVIDGYAVRIGSALAFRTYGFCGKGVVETLIDVESSEAEVAKSE